jgi:hypothetical protein
MARTSERKAFIVLGIPYITLVLSRDSSQPY